MANNDLLVQSSLPTPSQRKEITQQVVTKVTPAFVVSADQKSATASDSLGQQNRAAELTSKVERLNDHMQNFNRSLQFRVDDETGATVVKVIDSETNEVVRQIPSEELLDIRHAAEKYRGILLEAKV